MIGKRLGDYTLVSLLATGGMARIYEGVDVRLGRHAAVKVLELASNSEDDTLPARFEREARAVAKLDHPNIITIFQYGEFQGALFIVMPLIRGRDLSQEFAQARKAKQLMDVHRGLRLLEQIASALDYAHSGGVIHRDIKPSNILIDGNDRAILTDFGLVFQPKEDPTLGTAFGTPRYIAPEQAVASDQATGKSDIYALAVILFEMLTGQTPFNGTSAMEIALAHINDMPPSPRSINPTIPESAEREIMKALSKDPANRHATALEMIQAVKTAIDPEGTAETRISAPTMHYPLWDDEPEPDLVAEAEPEETPKRRSPLIRILFLLLVITIVGAEIISVLVNSNNTPTTVGDPTLIIADSAVDFLPANVIYTSSEFSIINPNNTPLNIQTLEFQSGDVGFILDSLRRVTLPPGMCIRIMLDGRSSPLPEGCNELLTQSVFADSSRFFWLLEAGFTVTRDGTLTATCPTAQRGTNTTCTLALPASPAPGI